MNPARVLAAAMLFLLPVGLLAAPGDLDPTFGSAGRVRVPLPNGAGAIAAAVQSDGKIVVVGTTSWYGPNNGFDVVAVRLNSNGTLDSAFDGDGITVLDYGSNEISSAAAVCITPTGKILIAGDTFGTPGFQYQTALIRLNADGSADNTFGPNGRRLYSVAEEMLVSKIRPQADGKFVIGGNTLNFQGTGDFKFFRVEADGAVDMSFGTNGRTIIDFNQAGDELADLTILPDGRIIGVGNSQIEVERSISVMRLLSNGQLDTSVGGGKLSMAIGYRDRAISIARQFDGKLLIAGETPSSGFVPLGMIVRLNADGTPDASFGSGGRVVRADSIVALNADPDGHIFFVGEFVDAHDVYDDSLASRAYVQALDVDGSASASFAPSGRALVDFGHDDSRSLVQPFALVRLVDGRQLVIGANNRSELLVARLAGPAGSFGGLLSVVPQSRADYTTPVVVSEITSSIRFLVQRTGGASGDVSVDYAAVSATAVAGIDFQPTAGTLTWADGETGTKLVTLPLINDNDYEPANETIEIQLSAPTGGAAIGSSRAGVAVSSDEGTALVSVTGSSALESASSVEFVLRRTGDARLRITVDYVINSATSNLPGATPGVDYTPGTGTVTWESGDAEERVIHVPLFDDAQVEGNEGIAMSISTTSAGVQGTGGGDTATILDNDIQSGYFAIFDRNLTHFREGSGAVLTLRVWRTDNGTNPVTYDVVTEPFAPGINAATAVVDYTLQTIQVSWPGGDTSSRDVNIQIADDQIREGTEGFLVNLRSGGSNYASTQVRIQDGAPAPAPATLLSFSQSQFNVIEGDQDAVVTVVRTGDISFPVSANILITGGTAAAGNDFTQVSSPVTLGWAAGDGTPKTMTLRIHEDEIPEVDESIEMFLTNPAGGAGLGFPQFAYVIIDDDDTPVGPSGPTVGFAQDTISVSEDAPYVDLPVTRTALGGDARVTFSIHSGSTADNGTEFVVEREPELIEIYNTTPLDWERSIRIYLNGDSRPEGDETFTVQLFGMPGFMPVGRHTITVTMVSNEVTIPPLPMAVGFVAAAVSQAENNISPVTLTVSRTGPATSALAVRYETAAGTAAAGSDFVAASGDLQWAAGDATDKIIMISLSNDAVVEPNETFTVLLSAPTGGATLASATATITITNDDVDPPPTPPVVPPATPQPTPSGRGGGGGALDSGLLAALAACIALAACRRHRGGRSGHLIPARALGRIQPRIGRMHQLVEFGGAVPLRDADTDRDGEFRMCRLPVVRRDG